MKRYSVLALFLALAIGAMYAIANAGQVASTAKAKSTCGCTDCQCPDCNGEFCTCAACECVGCGCAQ